MSDSRQSWKPTADEKRGAAELLATLLQIPTERRMNSLAVAVKVASEKGLLPTS